MLRFTCLVLLAAATTCLTASCEAMRNAKAKKKGGEASDKPVLVGVIEMINPEQNYVLIRAEHTATLPAGAELTAIDATGKQSRLALTPERKGVHLTADIKEGEPKVLNLVIYQPKKPAGAQTTAPTAPTTPPATPLPVVQPGVAQPGVAQPQITPTAAPEPLKIDPIPLEPLTPSAAAPKPAPPSPPNPQ